MKPFYAIYLIDEMQTLSLVKEEDKFRDKLAAQKAIETLLLRATMKVRYTIVEYYESNIR